MYSPSKKSTYRTLAWILCTSLGACQLGETGKERASKAYFGSQCGSEDLAFAPPVTTITGNELYTTAVFHEGSEEAWQPPEIPPSSDQEPVIVAGPRSEGYRITPIDILSLDVSMEVDARNEEDGTAHVVAELSFMVPEGGALPAFDLRQTVTKAFLDGREINVEKIKHLAVSKAKHIPDGEEVATTDDAYEIDHHRILQATFDPCSTHTLALHYDMARNEFDASGMKQNKLKGLLHRLSPMRPRAGFYASLMHYDLAAGAGAEQWFPAGSISDRYPTTIEARVQSSEDYSFISNCKVEEQGDNRFRVTCPEEFVGYSTYFGLFPAEALRDRQSHALTGIDGTQINLDLVLPDYAMFGEQATESRQNFVDTTTRALEFFEPKFGPYRHKASFTENPNFLVVALSEGKSIRGFSIEFEGATKSKLSALRHEICHQWFGRSIRPANGRDAWVDEAICTFYAPFEHDAYTDAAGRDKFLSKWGTEYADETNDVSWLAHQSLWHRSVRSLAHRAGGGLIYRLIQQEVLSQTQFEKITGLIARNKKQGSFLSTEEFEAYLYCNVADNEKHRVERAFQRYVYENGERVFERPACTPEMMLNVSEE